MSDIVERCRAAGRDELLSTGALYLDAADEIEPLQNLEADRRLLIIEIERLRAERDALLKNAERWRYWRKYWQALTQMSVAQFAGIDLSRKAVWSPTEMDKATDLAIDAELAKEKKE